MTLRSSVIAAVVLAGLSPAWAQKAAPAAPAREPATSGPISIVDMKAQLVLERTGKLSDNIVGAKKTFHNTVLGEGDAGSDKLARDLAQVKVTQQAKTGTRMLLNRVYGGFVFGDNGLSHKAFLVDNATCAPLEIEAKIGKTRKVAKIEFSCDLPKQ